MDKIVAIYKKKKMNSYWGFIFDTDKQYRVEGFMTSIHCGSGDYWLCFNSQKPEGIYTEVRIIARWNKGYKYIIK